MAKIYNCTVCEEEFGTKVARNNHFRNKCQQLINLTDGEGKTLQIARFEGMFQCVACPRRFTHGNNLASHWKGCVKRDGTESNVVNLLTTNASVSIDKENDLMEYLRYDGIHQLAVCVKCEFALPMEWVRKHFKDHHKIAVIHDSRISLTEIVQ